MIVGLGVFAIVVNLVPFLNKQDVNNYVSVVDSESQLAATGGAVSTKINFALSASTTVKSKYGAVGQVGSYCATCGDNLVLTKANDNNLDTLWCSSQSFNNTNYAASNDDWVTVDLGQNRSVSDIGIELATGQASSTKCNGVKNYEIRVQKDGGSTWTALKSGTNNTASKLTASAYPAVEARYVQLRMTKAAFNLSNLGVKEFRVWGLLPDVAITKVERDPATGRIAVSIKNNGGIISAPIKNKGALCVNFFGVSPVDGAYLVDRTCLRNEAYPIASGATVVHKFTGKAYNGTVYVGVNGTGVDFAKLPAFAFTSYPSDIKFTESDYSNNSFTAVVGPYTGAPSSAPTPLETKQSMIDLGDGGTYSDEMCTTGGTYYRNKWTGTIRIGTQTTTNTLYRYTGANLKLIGAYLGGNISWGNRDMTVTARGKCLSKGETDLIEVDPPIKFKLLGIITLFQTESAEILDVTYIANGDDWGTVTNMHKEPLVEDPQLKGGG